jgi:2-hydroxyacyl-CoA lyase 1
MKPERSNRISAKDLAARIAALGPERRAILEDKITRESVDGHTLIARSLQRHGVTHVYCVAGTPIIETFAACAHVGIRPIGVRHQQAGIMMAAAQNYVSGRLTAVSILSAGPGVTNAATGILVANDNCWPLLVLGGRRPLAMQGMGSFQELDGVAVFQSITKYCDLVDSTARIPECIERAFKTALSRRPGPVYLDLPEDILNKTTAEVADLPHDGNELPPLDAGALQEAAEIISKANRPALIIGKGVRWSEPYEEMLALVNDYQIPFITSPMGRGYISDDHPLCYNTAKGFLPGADAVLLLGARLDWTFRFGTQLAPDAQVIQVDIHEPEIGRNIKPAVGIAGDVKQVLQQLLQRLALTTNAGSRNQRAQWLAQLDKEREEKGRRLKSLVDNDSLPMSPHRMLKEIRDLLPKDSICVLDSNVNMAAAQQVLPAYLPASRLTAGSNGCMGVGIPFAIGAKLRYPERAVVAICGDAAFGFNAMEMETAVRHNIPVIVIIANNDGISGSMRQKLFASAERVTMFQPGIRYEEIIKVLGGYGEFVESPDQLRLTLSRALASRRAACINVKVDPNAPYPHD